MTYNTLESMTNLDTLSVLVRVDFNVPIKHGKIQDNSRIKAHLPTIQDLIKKGAKIILVSHLGRPKNKDENLTLLPVANELEKLLGMPISFCSSTDFSIIDQAKLSLKAGEILLLENIRFFEGETENDTFLASELSNHVSLYINDAFASSHRSHSSVDAICKFVPKKAAGFLMNEELDNLIEIERFKDSNSKIAVIASGSKVSTKLKLLENLITVADDLFIAGAMANTFFAALDYKIGQSYYEENMMETAKKIIKDAKNNNCHIHLPNEVVCANEITSIADVIQCSIENIPESSMILDVATSTIDAWIKKLNKHDFILINGPLGVFEVSPFDKGTDYFFNSLPKLPGYTVAGGGDTIFAINKSKSYDNFDFISTGGGALLEALEGKKLPGIKSLT